MQGKPVTQEIVFNYLDSLRKHGMVNMIKATRFVLERFNINEKQAKEYLLNWIKREKKS